MKILRASKQYANQYQTTELIEPIHRAPDPGVRRMALLLALAVAMGILFAWLKPESNFQVYQVEAASAAVALEPDVLDDESLSADSVIAPFFTREVFYWEPKIAEWSAAYGLDPNIIAIIMQVESCGDPGAVSGAGAMSLFQVMPFHFTADEDGFDPDTNARRGILYYLDRLKQTNGDVGLSFAGYNGGHVAAGTTWDNWAAETQRYYVWTTGLYQDLQSDAAVSPILQRWLEAGGSSLCQQAAQRLGL